MRSVTLLSALLFAAVTACGKSPDRAADTTGMMAPAMADGAAGDSAMAGGMRAPNGMHSDTLVERTEADLKALEGASPAAAAALLPAHENVVNALIADCEKMMRDEKMTVPAKWTTTVAELRRDLDRMRTADAASLGAMRTAHIERVRAVLSMRHEMMQKM